MEIRTVGGKRLRVEFKRDGTEVSFRVLQQDETLRGQGVLIERNGRAIRSMQHPALGVKNLFVRGREMQADNYIDTVVYDSEEEAQKDIETFCALVEELNRDRDETTVGGSRLKVKFVRCGATVTMQVLEQDETLRIVGYRPSDGLIIQDEAGYHIMSWVYPGIAGEACFVRGRNRNSDKAICSYTYPCLESAKRAIAAFSKLIEEINAEEPNRNQEKTIIGGPRLKVEFVRNRAQVTMRVLEQDESLRNTSVISIRTLACEGDYSVDSCVMPAIDLTTLFIRGNDRSADERSESYTYSSPDEAKAAITIFSKLIEGINNTDHSIVGGDRLQVEFWLEGAMLRAKVLKQDDALRRAGTIRSEDKYFVRSIGLPAITPNSMDVNGSVLYVRGLERSEDNKTAEGWFFSPLAAREALKAFSRLIEKINNEEHRIVGGPRLKVEFWREGNELTMQVLEQAEELREAGTIAKDGTYFVKSSVCPAVEWQTLYVRGGDRFSDNRKCSYVFTTPEQAAARLDHFTKLIEKINASQTKTLEIGPYMIKAVLTGDKLEIFREGRGIA